MYVCWNLVVSVYTTFFSERSKLCVKLGDEIWTQILTIEKNIEKGKNILKAAHQLVQRAFRRISGPWAMLIFMARAGLRTVQRKTNSVKI